MGIFSRITNLKWNMYSHEKKVEIVCTEMIECIIEYPQSQLTRLHHSKPSLNVHLPQRFLEPFHLFNLQTEVQKEFFFQGNVGIRSASVQSTKCSAQMLLQNPTKCSAHMLLQNPSGHHRIIWVQLTCSRKSALIQPDFSKKNEYNYHQTNTKWLYYSKNTENRPYD